MITVIGLGNVGCHLAYAFRRSGFFVNVWDRHEIKSSDFAGKYNCNILKSLDKISDDNKLILLCVSDSVIGNIAELISCNNSVIAHTAGSVNINIFESICRNYGVFYPLQSFKKGRELNYQEIPVFIEGNSIESLETIKNICNQVFPKLHITDSESRLQIHVAAVFASNFTNAMFSIAQKICRKQNVDFSNFLPLIHETCSRLISDSPENWQTGPAFRGDTSITELHKKLLSENKHLLEIYSLMSEYITSTLKKQ